MKLLFSLSIAYDHSRKWGVQKSSVLEVTYTRKKANLGLKKSGSIRVRRLMQGQYWGLDCSINIEILRSLFEFRIETINQITSS